MVSDTPPRSPDASAYDTSPAAEPSAVPSPVPDTDPSAEPGMVPGAEPVQVYRQRRQAHREVQQQQERRRAMVLALLAAAIIFFTALAFAPIRAPFNPLTARTGALLPAVALAAGFVLLLVRYLRYQAAIDRQERLLHLYDVALARVDGTERYSGQPGQPPAATGLFARDLFTQDLDLFGPVSLFSLLDTARTTVGELALARFLTAPVPVEVSCARQQAVRELTPQLDLRESIALLGVTHLQRVSAPMLDEWLDEVPPRFPRWLRPALFVTAALAAALLLRPDRFGLHPWSACLPWLGLVLLVQAALCLPWRVRAAALLTQAARLQRSLRLVEQGLALLDTLDFASPLLNRLQQQARQPAGAVSELKRLLNLAAIAEQRGQQYFLPLSLVTAAGMQTAISLAAWKRSHAEAMGTWLAAWGEFEALNALATYAFEHPEDAWPELLPQDHLPTFAAAALGHPLLAGAVTNDMVLDRATRFLLISGSNMAGKSTLLRALGMNAVLAYAGAPVRARSLRLTPLTLGASLALTDSLAEGKSKFLAEVERLAAIVAASSGAPVLFLVDEIFSGTNSADRRTAAEAVLDRLLVNGAIGALSTHDLALTALATEARRGMNVHMASPDPDDPLAFDYRLKPGSNTQSNALAIVRLLGL